MTLVAEDTAGKSSKPARLNFRLLESAAAARARTAMRAWF
jgi:hypothetical protein